MKNNKPYKNKNLTKNLNRKSKKHKEGKKQKKRNPKNILLGFLHIAYKISKKSLPLYSNKYSPQTFTRPQVMACLLLREYLKLDLRSLEDLIKSNPLFTKALELDQVPDYSTFCRHISRVSQEEVDKLAVSTLKQLPSNIKEELAAIDSTGMSGSNASLYYVSKTKKRLKGFIKLSCVAAMGSSMILASKAHLYPGPNDRMDFLELTAKAKNRIAFNTIVADKGYDGEMVHIKSRLLCRVKAIIPTIVPGKRVKGGHFRLQMANNFPHDIYAKRWKIESIFSALKRRFGGNLKSRSVDAQLNETMLKTVAYNIRKLAVLFFQNIKRLLLY
jgi:hypothetical protein